MMMNCDYLIAEVVRQLNDTKFYKKLDENSQEHFPKNIDEVLKKLKYRSQPEKTSPSGSNRIPNYLCLAKIHKELVSKLPIISQLSPALFTC